MARRRLGWLLWLLSAAALYFFENGTVTRWLLAASVALPALSVVCAMLCARRAVPTVTLTPLACAALNGGRLLHGCGWQAEVCAENLLTGERRTLTLRGAGPRLTFALTDGCCGVLRVTLTDCRVTDWFGLTTFPVNGTPQAELTLPPAPLPLTVRRPVEMAGYGISDGSRAPREQRGELAGVRDYVPGDDVGLIHWKLS